jgi:hypothetical protein
VLLPLPRRAALVGALVAVALVAFSYVRMPMAERPDFDRVADALVDAGWQPGDPILVVGSLPDFRSPLEWYLSGEVTLPEAEPVRPCPTMWIVTDVPEGRELIAGAVPEARLEVGSAEVARVPWDTAQVAAADAAGGRYLDSAAGRGCLRPLEDRVI